MVENLEIESVAESLRVLAIIVSPLKGQTQFEGEGNKKNTWRRKKNERNLKLNQKKKMVVVGSKRQLIDVMIT